MSRALAREVAAAKRAVLASAPGTDEHAQAVAWKERALRELLSPAAPRPAPVHQARPSCPRRQRLARWAAAAAVVLATSALANRFGGDELDHLRQTEQAIDDLEAEARYLSAEMAIEQAVVAAAGGRP